MRHHWENHSGKSLVLCRGRVAVSQDYGTLLFTVFLIIGTSALFFIFRYVETLNPCDHNYLMDPPSIAHSAPFLAEKLSVAVPVFAGG